MNSNTTIMKHDYLECICDSDEHVIRVTYFVNKANDGSGEVFDEDEIYVSVQLVDPSYFWGSISWNGRKDICGEVLPWWKFWKFFKFSSGRLWVGIKYILGYECKYGHWDVVTLNYDSAFKLRNLLDRYINSGLKKID